MFARRPSPHTKEHGILAKRLPEAEATRMTTARMTMVMIVDDGKIDEAYHPGSEATRMTTVMIVVGWADDAFYEMA